MKKLLLSIMLSIAFGLHNNSAQAQYINYSPFHDLDTMYSNVYTTLPPPYNLLYNKAFHMSTFQYSDGDLYTDTSRIDDVHQNYTEIIDMNLAKRPHGC